MKKNMGTADRIIRVLLAVIFAGLIFGGQVHGALAAILGILVVVFAVTSVVSFCPLYVLLGLSTGKKE